MLKRAEHKGKSNARNLQPGPEMNAAWGFLLKEPMSVEGLCSRRLWPLPCCGGSALHRRYIGWSDGRHSHSTPSFLRKP